MKTTHFPERMAGRLACVGLGLMIPLGAATATDYVVDSEADNTDTDGVITLREAVLAANTDTAVGDAPAGEADGDTITFDGGVLLLGGGVATITLGSPLAVTDDVSIDGELDAITGTTITISGGDATQLFAVDTAASVGSEAAVAFSNATLTEAVAESGAALEIAAGATVTLTAVTVSESETTGADAGDGGAVLNNGTLTIVDGAFTNNAASGLAGSGGALLSNGQLTVTGTTFTGNTANRAGGAVELGGSSTSTFSGVTMSDNSHVEPNPGNGGALHVSGAGDVTLTGGTYSNNTAGSEGGALWNSTGTMTIDGTASFTANTAAGNDADNGGGALFNNGGTLNIEGATIDGNSATGVAGSGGGLFNNGGVLTVASSTVSNNTAASAGGGLEDRAVETATTVNLSAVDFTGNSVTGIDDGMGTISAGNGGAVHISGNGSFTASGGTVSGNTAFAEGGGFWNGSGTMTLIGVTVDDNAAEGDDATNGGGGLFNEGGVISMDDATVISNNTALGTAGSGGGIFNNDGRIIAVGTTITGNTANRAGGGIEDKILNSTPSADMPSVRLTAVTLDGNGAGTDNTGAVLETANPGNGGGLHITGPGYVLVSNGTVSGNFAALEGGGLWNNTAPSTIGVSGTVFDGNIANGVTSDSVAVAGGGALFNKGGVMAVSNATISNNMAAGDPGGSGGGILNQGGQLAVTATTFTGNTAVRAGGALEDRSVEGESTVNLLYVTMDANSVGSTPGNGGAVHVTGENSTVTIDRSLVSNNTAANEGGGLWNFDNSVMQVYNSTVFANEASGTDGGGLFNRPNANTTLLNVTVASNSAAENGGGVFVSDTSTVAATNTLIGDNSAMAGADVFGTVDGGGYNLVEDTSDATINGPSNITGQDPALDSEGLQANGGPTQTVALQGASPAIDAALASVCAGPQINGFDQRGVTDIRPFDGDGDGAADCDIGAFELNNAPIMAVTATASTDVSVQADATGVVALGYSLTNQSDETVTYTGFSGSLGGTGDFDTIAAASIVLDANGDGVVDDGETTIAGSVSFDDNAGTFTASFDTARSLDPAAGESLIVTVDFGTSTALLGTQMLAGGGLMLIGLAGLGGLSRRQQGLIAAIATAAALAGCGNSSSNFAPEQPPAMLTYSVTLTAVAAIGNESGSPADIAGLPLAGPVITVDNR